MQPTIPTPAELEDILIEKLGLSAQERNDFLYPKYELGDPFLFEDMDFAVTRIYKAISDGEQIGIYADYDCDGIPGAVVLLDLFKAIGIADRVHIYIPDRHDEGYGVSELGIETLRSKEVTLIITVDVGITALAQVAFARSCGIDVIVTDHHSMLPELPSALAVVHPMKGEYPNKDLCGAGVAFMLVRAFLQKYGQEFEIKEGWEKWLLDLVGFATLADMVPLIGENRVLASYGLTVMRKTKRLGLRTLFAKNNIYMEKLTEQDLTFSIAPRLNAASRMDTPMIAFELLTAEDSVMAEMSANRLEEANNERKLLVARIVKEAHSQLDRRELKEIVVIGNIEWRPAVLGLVANKLQDTYNKSFFVWGGNGGELLKGSCRMLSIHHASLIFQALPEGVLVEAGGHQAAGGFSVAKEKVHFLEQELNDAISRTKETEVAETDMEAIDMSIGIATSRHYQVLRKFGPFGVANPEPTFLFKDLTIKSVKKFGKNKEHLECVVGEGTHIATAFTFFVDKKTEEKLCNTECCTILATLEPGWRGGMRLKIKKVL